ncbi:YdcF family protein [Actinomyces sp. 2119]|uniref:YdcF family protein n=1 Tax=Actinomyces sp. 2119 TaxID=2321393 RepID=UPI000E6C38C8|nr:YdcF family protein [Actinomyces sp. 2119]RJF44788.1 YdcF family protein [Actinomyces sp. 2119]
MSTPGLHVLQVAGGAVLIALSVATAAELVHLSASRWYLGQDPAGEKDAREVVVVLGHADAGVTAGHVNRRRAVYALRSRTGAHSLLVASGGSVAGPVAEAELLAGYARALGYTGGLLTETRSRSTWENIRNVIPVLESAQRIVIVSDAVHAAKARRLLHMQRPDLAARLARAEDYRPGEDLLLKVPSAVLGTADLLSTYLAPRLVASPAWVRRRVHRRRPARELSPKRR